MITFVLFAVSGVAIVSITAAKRVADRKKTTVFILRLISLGDERLRKVHHEGLRQYSFGKEKFGFWLKKQLPLKIKSFWNRIQSYVGGKAVKYLGDVRGSRLLKRPDGISEFFKNVSEIEKGGGEINETLENLDDDFYIQTSEERHAAKAQEAAMLNSALERSLIKTGKPRKPRAPRKKKVIEVTEVLN
jgi:hypothetical protein